MTIKAIITDLDGTLLNSNKQTSAYTKHILERTRKEGIHFCMATGRCPESVEYKLEEWGLDENIQFILAMNGSTLYDRKEKYRQDFHMMSGDALIEVVKHFEDLPVLFQVLYGPARYTSRITPEWIQRSKLFGETLIQVDMKEFLHHRITNKFILLFEPDLMPVILERARHFHDASLYGFPSGKDCFEYVDSHINKGFAVQKLADLLNIRMDEIAAFGDAGNDIEMLESVGLSVAMKNGSDAIKAVAMYQTDYDNNEDGVAHFIEDHILKTDD